MKSKEFEYINLIAQNPETQVKVYRLKNLSNNLLVAAKVFNLTLSNRKPKNMASARNKSYIKLKAF